MVGLKVVVVDSEVEVGLDAVVVDWKVAVAPDVEAD